MSQTLQEHLQRQMATSHGGRFYLLRTRAGHPEAAHQYLLQWTKELLQQTLLKWGPARSVENAADILFVGDKLAFGENLSQDDFVDFWSFLKWRSFEYPQRFMVICRGSTLPLGLTNKLLKTLEEPQENTNIFLLCEDSRPLLPTLEGRAIKLFVPPLSVHNTASPQVAELMENFQQKKIAPAQVIDWIRANPQEEQALWDWMFAFTAQKKHSFEEKENFLKNLRLARETQIYHQSAGPLWFTLLSAVL